MPALLIRMLTVPNASSALWMTAAPSVAEEALTTALPPAIQVPPLQYENLQMCTIDEPFVISSTTF
jgi:hypothetical protein